MSYKVFLSHGADNRSIAERWLKLRVEESGAGVFLDSGSIDIGDDYREIILKSSGIVAIRYGPSERELQELGILSLLGTRSLLRLDEFDGYVAQLTRRVQESEDA